jgi:predicted heme/steroid binding protein
MSPERLFTLSELRIYNGDHDEMYVCHAGIVYDVSQSKHWRSGIHENLHFPGQDLTGEINEAPHGEEVFLHPDIHIVGRMK